MHGGVGGGGVARGPPIPIESPQLCLYGTRSKQYQNIFALSLSLCVKMASALAMSPGSFALKKGSYGSTCQSVVATRYRWVKRSILRRSSSTSAWRRSVLMPTGQSAITGCVTPPELAQTISAFFFLLFQARDEIDRQKRRIGRHTDRKTHVRTMQSDPIEASENAGKRTLEPRHIVGDHRQAETIESCRVAIGVQDEPGALRPHHGNDARKNGGAADCSQRLVATAHALGPTAREQHAKAGVIHQFAAPLRRPRFESSAT